MGPGWAAPEAAVIELDEPAVVADMLLVVQLITRWHDDPTAYGGGAVFERLVELWRPALVQAGR